MSNCAGTSSTDDIKEYFCDFSGLSEFAQNYLIDSLKLWAVSGLLHIVCMKHNRASIAEQPDDNEGSPSLVTVSRSEFNSSAALYAQFGPLGVFNQKSSDEVEVRLNLPVAHRFAHQLRAELTGDHWNDVMQLYHRRLSRCAQLHEHIPPNSKQPEHLSDAQVANRCFVTAKARTSPAEYWAESVGAFSTKPGRRALRDVDPDMYALMLKVVSQPERVLNPNSIEELHRFQSRMGLESLIADIASL